jgi:hypothetical protein
MRCNFYIGEYHNVWTHFSVEFNRYLYRSDTSASVLTRVSVYISCMRKPVALESRPRYLWKHQSVQSMQTRVSFSTKIYIDIKLFNAHTFLDLLYLIDESLEKGRDSARCTFLFTFLWNFTFFKSFLYLQYTVVP